MVNGQMVDDEMVNGEWSNGEIAVFIGRFIEPQRTQRAQGNELEN